MRICKRTALYLCRRKGKNMLLFLILFMASALLLICFSVLNGTEQAAKDLRSGIGAAFYIRPYQEMIFEGGTISEGEIPVISQSSIEKIIDFAHGQVKTYNTEHYGYAKSKCLHFLPGFGDNESTNMGRITAVRDSRLTDVFLNGKYELLVGRHIQPEDENKILISEELAAENGLKAGDIITLSHARLEQKNGEYTDAIPQKTVFAVVEIVGIFRCDGTADSADLPTAGKAVNHIYSDCRLTVNLQEQREGIYEGEIAFYITDPLELDALTERVKSIGSIDWGNHILRENDFLYKQISGQLQNLQKLALALIFIVSALSVVVLMLILLLRIRGRVYEAGIYLSIGKSKAEIIGQFAMEILALLCVGFGLAFLLWFLFSDMVSALLFAPSAKGTGTEILQAGDGSSDYLQPDFFCSGVLFVGESAVVMLTVLIAGGAILRLKPKELLTRMS